MANTNSNAINPDALYRAASCAQIFSVGKSTWWKWVADGRIKRGHRIGARTTVWEGSYLIEIRQKLISETQV